MSTRDRHQPWFARDRYAEEVAAYDRSALGHRVAKGNSVFYWNYGSGLSFGYLEDFERQDHEDRRG